MGAGRVVASQGANGAASPLGEAATTKSDRSRADARAAEGMGTACTRAGERMAAAVGLASRQTEISAGDASFPVLETRWLSGTGHQTAVICTARRLLSPSATTRPAVQ